MAQGKGNVRALPQQQPRQTKLNAGEFEVDVDLEVNDMERMSMLSSQNTTLLVQNNKLIQQLGQTQQRVKQLEAELAKLQPKDEPTE